MDKTYEMSLLFDFFGDLLTDKQKECFQLYYESDLSLSEIAEIFGISRQGVRDMLVRTESSLREFEAKTGVVQRFRDMQSRVALLEKETAALLSSDLSDECREAAEKISAGLASLLD